MYVARSHEEINESLNKIAGTDNIQYATPWDMSTRTGRSYMLNNYTQVGKMFASNALQGLVGGASKLMTSSHLTPVQKATLSAIALSSTEQEYKSALLSAVKHGALTNMATRVLSRPNALNAVPPQKQPDDFNYFARVTDPEHYNDSMMVDSEPTPAEPITQLAEAAAAKPIEQLAETAAAEPIAQLAETAAAESITQLAETAAAEPSVQLAEPATTQNTMLSEAGALLLQGNHMQGGASLVPSRKRRSKK